MASSSSACDHPNFDKADSRNLPKVENVMILEFVTTSNKHCAAEIRGAKMLMSSRDSYLNTAVGYVQVSRSSTICTVKAKIVPEHRISNKLYTVTCKIDEINDVIIDSECHDCAAAKGGCKHSLVLLFWLEKKSSEPSTTSIQCYWNKPPLSSARSDHVLSKNIFNKNKKPKLSPRDGSILAGFQEECERRNLKKSLILKFCSSHKYELNNVFDIMLEFVEKHTNHDCHYFQEFLKNIINKEVIDEINIKSVGQSDCKYWHTVRLGRLTASKLYEAAHCSTDGSLVQQILGGYKVPQTKAILRGKKLEDLVFKQVETALNKKIQKSGFVLINGILGASPDGVGDDFVLEIKCPVTEKSSRTYVKDGTLQEKFKVQLQCQMLACLKPKGLFCVADPNYENNKKIVMIWQEYDENYINMMVNKAEAFWKKYIFPKILVSAK